MLILIVAGAAPAAAAVPGNVATSTIADVGPVDSRATASGATTPTSTATPTYPSSLNLYNASGFRYQDPNMYACTSTSAMDLLNFIALGGKGGTAFRWKVNLSGTTRDAILSWQRTHDTLKGGYGSDPHGWRNALNYYGWGDAYLWEGKQLYDDRSYTLYDSAVKSAVRR